MKSDESSVSAAALMEAVKNSGYYLRKVKNPEPGKTYFRIGFEQSGFDRLSPAVYLGNDNFHDCVGDFDSCAKSDYWEFAPAFAEQSEDEPQEPNRRYFTITAHANGKSVNITYNPHDAEAVKAAEVWRNSLFSGFAQFKAVEPVAVKVGDIAPFGDEYRRQKDELKKASAPLVEYLKRHGDPHTTITVTRDSAAERQDERGVTFDSEKPAETVKRGHWEKSDIPNEEYVCSVCGGACWYYGYNGRLGKSRYCQNCGARMENALGNGGD